MKFANIALISAASANFLQETILELDAVAATTDYTTTKPWEKYAIQNKVGEGICQPHEGAIFWDLKHLDAHKSVEYIGAGQTGFDGHTFAVEICENSFDASTLPVQTVGETKLTVGAIPATTKKGNAYWTTASTETFIPQYSFLSGNFKSTYDKTTDEYNGWTLTYASQENCGTSDAPQPFVMTVNAICQEPAKDAKTSAGVWSDYKLTEDCAASVTYTGKAGCVAFNGDAVWDAIKPFTGVILILVGGLMTFAGAKFLFQLVSAVVTLVVTIVFYLTISNLFFGLQTTAGPKIGLLIAALILGIGAAFLSYKLTIRFAIPIVAGVGGGFGFKLVSNLAGIRNEYAAIGILVLGICAGAYLGYKLNEFVRTVGTAFLGSYILIRGAGFFFGGFPEAGDVKNVNIHEVKAHDKIVWYFIGFIVFFIAGSIVQYKLFHHDEDLKAQQEEMFQGQNEDDDKKCGCF